MNKNPQNMTQEEKYEYLKFFGWMQCDYPHSSAKDMWYNPDVAECDMGKYIDTEDAILLYV